MSETVEQILKREEETYFKLLNAALEIFTTNNNLPENNKKRLADEMEILHKRKFSKTIWYLLLITKKATKDNEPYFVRTTIADLYLLFALGIIKTNPIETKCCYQACLGTKEEPKRWIMFDISFREGYINKIRDYIKSIDKDAGCFHYTYHFKEHQFNESSMIVIPKGINVHDYFDVASVRDVDMKVISEREYGFEIGVMFNTLTSPMMSILKEMCDFYEDTSFEEAFEDYKAVLNNERFSSEYELKLLKRYKINTFNDAIDFQSMSHNSHKVQDIESYVFPDRETVFYYFLDEIGLSEKQSYTLMEDIRKGRFAKKYFDIDILAEKADDNVVFDLNNILYLFTRGHTAEYLYSKVLLAHYFRYHEKEYLKLKEKYDN